MTTVGQLECPICIEEIGSVVAITYCGHVFCQSCLQQQYEYKKKCPICRGYLESFRIESVHNEEEIEELKKAFRKYEAEKFKFTCILTDLCGFVSRKQTLSAIKFDKMTESTMRSFLHDAGFQREFMKVRSMLLTMSDLALKVTLDKVGDFKVMQEVIETLCYNRGFNCRECFTKEEGDAFYRVIDTIEQRIKDYKTYKASIVKTEYELKVANERLTKELEDARLNICRWEREYIAREREMHDVLQKVRELEHRNRRLLRDLDTYRNGSSVYNLFSRTRNFVRN